MAEAEKDAVMPRFRSRAPDLVTTPQIIAVGEDAPNASFLNVEHAERFGLSQLHQLRGRVSRGTVAGQCYLFTGTVSEDAKERLRAFTRTTDGFALAELDA